MRKPPGHNGVAGWEEQENAWRALSVSVLSVVSALSVRHVELAVTESKGHTHLGTTCWLSPSMGPVMRTTQRLGATALR